MAGGCPACGLRRLVDGVCAACGCRPAIFGTPWLRPRTSTDIAIATPPERVLPPPPPSTPALEGAWIAPRALSVESVPAASPVPQVVEQRPGVARAPRAANVPKPAPAKQGGFGW